MTIKESILRALKDFNAPKSSRDIYQQITNQGYYSFTDTAQTPQNTISALLGDFIRSGDSRVKRIKEGRTYYYYLSNKEIDISIQLEDAQEESTATSSYDELDLHPLLVTYLNSLNSSFAKTINHQKSKRLDKKAIWTHPDVVGVEFLELKENNSREFLKAIARTKTIKISSYEIKREIKTDAGLKEVFFQAVSNSSWANYGYLVAYEFNDSLSEEIERLNQSFGIGIIELNANIFESKIKHPARYRDLDFKTIDKLAHISPEFSQFIGHIESLLNAEAKYIPGSKNQFIDFCDKFLESDKEIKEYCLEKNIPSKFEEA